VAVALAGPYYGSKTLLQHNPMIHDWDAG